MIQLASNENPLGMPATARQAATDALTGAALYPDATGRTLKEALAARLGVTPDWLVLGSGSSEILTMTALAVVKPGEGVLWSQYGFVVYQQAAALARGVGQAVPAQRYGHDLKAMAAAITPQTRLVFVANPSNPTGTFLEGGRLQEFLAQVPRETTVLLDEAYTEYLAPRQRYDAIGWLRAYPNLIVARTFSKAYGLAGLRIGYGVAQPALAAKLNAIRPRFNVTTPALAAATAALVDTEFVQRTYDLNRAGRAQLSEGLGQLGVETLPSAGNFVMACFADARGVHAALLRAGIAVSTLDNYALPDWLRITVGTQEQNAAVLAAVADAARA